jgi:hypothetical protein
VTVLEPPLLWTTMVDGPTGSVLVVVGELSSLTAPAVDSLVDYLLTGREHIVEIDLREASVIAPAAERLLERWGAVPGQVSGTYCLGSSSDDASPTHRAR